MAHEIFFVLNQSEEIKIVWAITYGLFRPEFYRTVLKVNKYSFIRWVN